MCLKVSQTVQIFKSIFDPRVVLGLVMAGIFGIETLPYLQDYPLIETAQVGIYAPAHKLATLGTYGSDLFVGFHDAESFYYDFMPLYSVMLALAFKVIGIGTWQARMVSVLSGLATLFLTYQLGKMLFRPSVGLISAGALLILPMTVSNYASGDLYPGQIPLLDISRVIRYDVMVPVWALLACISFLMAEPRRSGIAYVCTGLAAGLATLTQLYGIFILGVIGGALLWEHGRGILRQRAIYLIVLGWIVALSPWIVYISMDLPAYLGQMARHGSRFNLLNPGFYFDNLTREPWRYVKFLGGFRHPVLLPRPGLWLILVSIVAANISLWQNRHRDRKLEDRFAILSLPVLVFSMAAMVSFKRYTYLSIILPFLGLEIGLGTVKLWQWSSTRKRILGWLFLLWIGAAALEGSLAILGLLNDARAITPYKQLTADLAGKIPQGSRVLLHHNYWIGLPGYHVNSIDNVFSQADPDFGIAGNPTIEEVIEAYRPDFVVVKEALLKSYITDPNSLPNQKIVARWQQLDEYLIDHCKIVHRTRPDPNYGVIALFQC